MISLQFQQSMCYEAAITNWRRLKAAPDARTMGVLYWQLNDIWAVSALSHTLSQLVMIDDYKDCALSSCNGSLAISHFSY